METEVKYSSWESKPLTVKCFGVSGSLSQTVLGAPCKQGDVSPFSSGSRRWGVSSFSCWRAEAHVTALPAAGIYRSENIAVLCSAQYVLCGYIGQMQIYCYTGVFKGFIYTDSKQLESGFAAWILH